MADDMLVWLRATIEARKAVAEAATPISDPIGAYRHWDDFNGTWVTEADSHHIELNNPQDTIDWCEADLAILDEHRLTEAWPNTGPDCGYGCRICALDDRQIEPEGVCRTVRLLARGYRHRPGWNPDWASAAR